MQISKVEPETVLNIIEDPGSKPLAAIDGDIDEKSSRDDNEQLEIKEFV